MHPAIPLTLAEVERMSTRMLFQAEVMADAYDRAERRQALKRAAAAAMSAARKGGRHG